MRGATEDNDPYGTYTGISIHAPHAGSDVNEPVYVSSYAISIHAPHAGSDGLNFIGGFVSWGFQSTPPMRGATLHSGFCNKDIQISIHAPHAGSDG